MTARPVLLLLALAALLAGCTQPAEPVGPAVPDGGGGEPSTPPGAGEDVLREAVQPPSELSGVDELESELADLNDLDDFLQEDVLAGDEVASTQLQ